MSRFLLYKAKDEQSHKELGAKLRDLPEGEYVIEVKKNRAVRSLKANKYYRFVLNLMAIETGISHDDMHEAMKHKFNSKVIFYPSGGTQCIGESTSSLDVAEFAGYVNRVKQYAQDDLRINIPELKDVDYRRWMEMETLYEENFRG